MKMRVLHVVHWPKSGIVTLVRDMLPLFNETIFEQHVIFFEHDDETIHQFNTIATSVNSLDFSSSPLKAAVKYRKLLRDLRPNVLHTHSFSPTFLGEILSRDCLHIITVHNTYPYFFKKNIKSAIKRGCSRKFYRNRNNQVVAVSRDVQLALLTTISNHMRVHVVENGIHPVYFKKKYEGHKSEEDSKELISVGRLSTQKAYNVLLRAFKLVLKEKPFLRLTIVGDGPERKNLLALSNQLGIYEKVYFAGWVADPVNILMKKNFVYVCSSEFEGLPIAVLEAMAAGLPVISTNITGITTIIKDNETGFLVSPGDPQQLAQKIGQILDDDILRIRVARRGQQYIHDNYDIATTVRQYEALYMGEKCAELP